MKKMRKGYRNVNRMKSRTTLYNDAPLNLLRTSCRRRQKLNSAGCLPLAASPLLNMKWAGSKATVLMIVIACLAGVAIGSVDGALLTRARQVFAPLPADMPSTRNPITPEKIKLGKMLLYETRISVDGTVSCTKCHPMALYAADGLRKAIGDQCRGNPRNSPTLFNAAAQISAHWIGNRTDVEDQARQSVIGPPAFGMPSYQIVEQRLKELGYGPLFKQAFPEAKDPVTMDNFAMAVGAFERTLVTPGPFDAFLKGDQAALDQPARKGLKTFMQGGCVGCHAGPYLGGQQYQKFGITAPYWQYTKSPAKDEGRYAVTKNEADRYFFKVPVLRNVAKTPPYFHDGTVDRLEDAVWIMGKVQLGKGLTKKEVKDITAFLDALTGEIPQDALTVPVLP